MLELLHDPALQKRAFIEACTWADDVFLCLAWIEPGDSLGPSFADLEPHHSKVRQAIVGLARFQSYPGLLRRLHRASVLRLVSTLDGSFSPNLYVFRRGTRVRVIVASAPFTSTRYARPCESFVVFEGERDDPFALRALQLLDRCRASAHVPSSTELDAYEAAWADARSGGHAPDAVAGLVLEGADASGVGELALVTDPRAVLEAFVEIRDSLAAAASVRVPCSFFPSGTSPGERALRTTLFWSALGAWTALHRANGGYSLHVGFTKPWEVDKPVAALSLGDARDARDRMAVACGDQGKRLLVHLGDQTNAYAADVEIKDPAGAGRAAIVGEIGGADFVQSAAAFALRTSRHRANRAREES